MTAPCIAGPCSSRRTSRSERGDGYSTTPTLRRPSSTGFSRAAGTSNSGARPTGRATPDLTSGAAPSQDQRHRPEFPENTGQSFRNPQPEPRTLGYLVDLGYRYDASFRDDDLPHALDGGGGRRILEIPQF